MGEHDARVDAAIREAMNFGKELTRFLIGGQVVMVGILCAMSYFNVSLKWIVVVGFFLSVGTICGLIEKIGIRLDAGRSFVEQWARDLDASRVG
jgi:hypothetical protein